jgi:hypothetical protein
MTKVKYIAGIPYGEYMQRGANVGPASYIPYTQLTVGEMKLALLKQQAKMYAQVYPEVPEYKQAVSMLSNALNAGVSNGIKFIGAVPDELQQVARAIANAKSQTAPASGKFMGPRTSLGQGINADPIVPVVYREYDCVQKATEWTNQFYKQNKDWDWYEKVAKITKKAEYARYLGFKAECETKAYFENLLNQRLEQASCHMLYKGMPVTFPPAVGTQALTKRLFQLVGLEAVAGAAEVKTDLLSLWTEVGIQRSNAVNGNAPYGSFVSSALLTPSPQKWAQVANDAKSAKIGEPITITLAAVTALVAAIGTALAEAAKLRNGVEQKKQFAFSSAQGFGSKTTSPEQDDFAGGGDDDEKAEKEKEERAKKEREQMILYGGLALGAYLLLK